MAGVPPALAEDLRDRYTLERELGRGGMACVYLAHDLRHDRLVALKVLHSELAQALGPERFQREIKLAARLQHPISSPSMTPASPPDSSGSPCPMWKARAFGRGWPASGSCPS